MRGPGKPAFNKSDISKMSALVARSEKEGGRMSPLREKAHARQQPAWATREETTQQEPRDHSVASDVRSSKSMPKPQTRKPGYEPMRMNKRQSHQVQDQMHSKVMNVVQETRLIEQERNEKAALQRAFSEEKNRNLNLMDRTRNQESRLEQLEREVNELRSHNMRLRDSEGVATRELESMR